MTAQPPRRVKYSLRTALMLSAGAMLAAVLLSFAIPLSISRAHHTLDEARVREFADTTRLATRISDAVAAVSDLTPEVQQARIDLGTEVRAAATKSGLSIVVVDVHRRVLFDSSGHLRAGTVAPDANGDLAATLARNPRFSPEQVVSRAGRLVLTLPVFEAGRAVGAIAASRPLSSVRSETLRANLVLAAFALLALAVGLAVASSLASLVARPVRRLEATATRLGSGDLEARASEDGTREFASLARSFNAMADDLASNLRAQQDFAANASHQLRTPLTALQLRLEAIAAGSASGVDTEQEARHALTDIGRLTGLMQDLLTLARASAPVRGGEDVDLSELAATVVDRWTETALRHGKQLALSVRDPAIVVADPHDLEDLADNLIDNAVRYSGDAARIDVAVNGSIFSVTDHGVPIPDDEREQIFERFFRGTRARSASSGTGLGLAIVDALARRWGARVSLHTGNGTRFEVRFPEDASRTGNPRPHRHTR